MALFRILSYLKILYGTSQKNNNYSYVILLTNVLCLKIYKSLVDVNKTCIF